MIGPGKYDDLCTHVRKQARARGAAVIVIGGEKGGGFSVQATMEDNLQLSKFLREMADEIDRSGPLSPT